MRTRAISPVCRRGHPQPPENRITFPSCPRGRCRECYLDQMMFNHEAARERRERKREEREERDESETPR
jgi:hypothetical protein